MDPDESTVELSVEAYGTVTNPPEDNGEEDNDTGD